jgi:hypothetical protein
MSPQVDSENAKLGGENLNLGSPTREVEADGMDKNHRMALALQFIVHLRRIHSGKWHKTSCYRFPFPGRCLESFRRWLSPKLL